MIVRLEKYTISFIKLNFIEREAIYYNDRDV